VTANQLAIWMYDTRVALVEEDRRRLRLRYTTEALEAHDLGTPLLSVALPLVPEAYPNAITRTFLDGLLPEGEPRRVLAEDLRLRADDTFGLIAALGRDCAGALVIQDAELPAPPRPNTLTSDPLSEEQLAELAANLRSAPLGIGDRVRISLAGMQEKLVLTRRPDGSWGRPVDGTPSTHILKPGIREFPDSVENEAFCMRLAAHLGLDVPPVEIITTSRGQKLLVVTRYDRLTHGDGGIERIHQEDFCQATGRPPLRKYEEDGGPSWREIANVIEGFEPPDLERLLGALVVHVLVANGDGHAKNLSLLHQPSGAMRLAPLYDVLSTLPYGDDRLAIYVDSVQKTVRVTGKRIVNEASGWGLARSRASSILADLLDRVPNAADHAAHETAGLPERFSKVVEAQLELVRSEM
jgi:serine/threonine-protein kinase HipA